MSVPNIKYFQNIIVRNIPTKKKGEKKLEKILHQRIPKDGKYAHEKMFNVISQWEMKTKTIMRYHEAPMRMAKILPKISTDDLEHILLVGMQNCTATT